MKDSPPPPSREPESSFGAEVIRDDSQEKEDVVVMGDPENPQDKLVMPTSGNENSRSVGIGAASMPVTSKRMVSRSRSPARKGKGPRFWRLKSQEDFCCQENFVKSLRKP